MRLSSETASTRPLLRSFIALLLVTAFTDFTASSDSAQQKHLSVGQAARLPHTAVAREDPTHHSHSSDTLDVRAIATLAPAKGSPPYAVRAPSLAAGSHTGGLSSRLPARSLQDWEVEDLVLLATVDGKIYARDRRTGEPRWAVEADRPMVETTYHSSNLSEDSKSSPYNGFIWIVEPSQDGSLYGFTPGSPLGMQKLGLTVKQLVEELSPYSSEDPPVVYTGEKKNTLFTVDAASGKILKMFSAGGSAVMDEGSCRRIDSLDYLDDEACGAIGTLTLARTEYTIAIQSSATGKQICTIRYFEWGPNHRDRDLYNQYISAKDNQYIYSKFDGRVLALEHFASADKSYELGQAAQQAYKQKFASPVAQVFDIARPVHASSRDTPLIVLPQPSSPGLGSPTLSDESSLVFVNCTNDGSWYALSESAYPLVTDGAAPAICSQREYLLGGYDDSLRRDPHFRKTLVGVHSLSYQDGLPPQARLIGTFNGGLTIDPPSANRDVETVPDAEPPAEVKSATSSSWLSLLVAVAFTCVATVALTSRLHLADLKNLSLAKSRSANIDVKNFDGSTTVPVTTHEATAISNATSGLNVTDTARISVKKEVQWADGVDGDATLANDPHDRDRSATYGETDEAESGVAAEGGTIKKKKAHRGRRGGRKVAEKKAAADTNASRNSGDQVQGSDDINEEDQINAKNLTLKPDAVNSTGPAGDKGPHGLQNLVIHQDRVIGSGSGGTFVFEGEFEGRDVAVKRMLPQYFELASQEVSLLEQSEDHPNVIRYFCRRADENFLYIALELCQASLWDIFRDGRHDDLPDAKHASLIEAINKDPKRVLRQLAEGVKYLHGFRIVHRDIKPQNMLIAYPKKINLSAFPRLVISDFGLCKTLPDNASTLIGTTGNAGTAGWKAPELIFKPKDTATSSQHSTNGTEGSQSGLPTQPGAAGVKRAVDIFSLGCVFFYVLTQGQHPFDDDEGWQSLRERNIKTGRANFKELKWLGPDAEDLIKRMLSADPVDRPTAVQVLQHPFFWEAEDRLEFLSTASDRFDQEPRDGTSQVLIALERQAEAIIPKGVNGMAYSASHSHLRTPSGSYGAAQMALPIPAPDFFAQLDPKFIDTLGRQRKYDPAKLADLLRALRNKYHHWDDMPLDVKKKVGAVPEGYLSYWEQRFPALVVGVWRATVDTDICEERRFWKWFGVKEK